MFGLLHVFIERINSLQNYYLQELKTIQRKENRVAKENKFGYLIDYYFSVLATDNKEEMEKESFKRLKDYAEKNVRIVKPIEDGKVFYEFINLEELKNRKLNLNIKEAAMLFKRYYDMLIIHSDNTLIMLLIRFEEFVSNVLRTIFEMFPQKYLDGQAITYSEIQKRDLNEIRGTILDREIESVMRDSYTKWFEILASHKIALDSCKYQLEVLKEIYARRNIVVHNSGYVNETYLKNSGNTKTQIGERIGVTKEYLVEAFNCIKTLIFAIVVQSSKLYKDSERKYLEEVFAITFEELDSKNYSVTKVVYEMLKSNSALSEEVRNMSKVNSWISDIEMGYDVSDEIERFDTSALDNMFKVAKLILQKKNVEATVILDEELRNGKVFPNVFNWPLFIHYIESPEYAELKDRHRDLFDRAVLDTKDSNPNDIKILGSSISKDVEEAEHEEKQKN